MGKANEICMENMIIVVTLLAWILIMMGVRALGHVEIRKN